jgi:hypothetical protein
LGCSRIGGEDGDVRVKAEHGRSVVAEIGPFGFGDEGLAQVEYLRRNPGIRALPAGRVMDDDFLKTSPYHLSEAHLVLGGDALRLPVECVWDLHLCFYHDGILPANDGLSRMGHAGEASAHSFGEP